jgi:hypothetical protein
MLTLEALRLEEKEDVLRRKRSVARGRLIPLIGSDQSLVIKSAMLFFRRLMLG